MMVNGPKRDMSLMAPNPVKSQRKIPLVLVWMTCKYDLATTGMNIAPKNVTNSSAVAKQQKKHFPMQPIASHGGLRVYNCFRMGSVQQLSQDLTPSQEPC